jgi:hypothetical protein
MKKIKAKIILLGFLILILILKIYQENAVIFVFASIDPFDDPPPNDDLEDDCSHGRSHRGGGS